MILAEITVDGTLYRVSDDTRNLTNRWYNRLTSLEPLTLETSQVQGGYCKPSSGDLILSTLLFEDVDVPPLTLSASIYYLPDDSTDESAKVLIFGGTFHNETFDSVSATYVLREPSYDETTAATTFNTDLETDIDTLLTGIAEISSVDDTYSRSSLLTIPNWTITPATQNIVIADDMAAYFSHLFYIRGSIAYLVDCLSFAVSHTITDYKHEGRIEFSVDLRSYATDDAGAPVYSSFPSGRKLPMDEIATANQSTHFTNALTIANRRVLDQIIIPFEKMDTLYYPGDRVILLSTQEFYKHLSVVTYIKGIAYDFFNGKAFISGDSEILTTSYLLDNASKYLLDSSTSNLLAGV